LFPPAVLLQLIGKRACSLTVPLVEVLRVHFA
jgi:hypothetical protein